MIGGSNCKDILDALEPLFGCSESDKGTSIRTQCLYPSFEPVEIFVVRYGDGYEVHDGGGAIRAGWDHARDLSSARRIVSQHSEPHQLKFVNDSILARVDSRDWLMSAILIVANVSATAAHAIVQGAAQAIEHDLAEMIYSVVSKVVPKKHIAREFEIRGNSGKMHKFDLAIRPILEASILMDAVSPHHVSIASRYVAFSDTREHQNIFRRFAVHDKPLAHDDASLLQEVADVVPFLSLSPLMDRLKIQYT